MRRKTKISKQKLTKIIVFPLLTIQLKILLAAFNI